MLRKIFKVCVFSVFSALFMISCGSTPEESGDGQSAEEKASVENTASEDAGLAPNSEVMSAIADAEAARDAAGSVGADKSHPTEFTSLKEALEILKGKGKKTKDDVIALHKIRDAFKALKSYTNAVELKKEIDSNGWKSRDEETYKKGENSLKEVDEMLAEMNPDDLDSAKNSSEQAEESFAKIVREAKEANEVDLSKRMEAAKNAAEKARGEAVSKGLDKKRAADFSKIDSKFQSLKKNEEKSEKMIGDFQAVEKAFRALIENEEKNNKKNAQAEEARKRAEEEKKRREAQNRVKADSAIAKEIAEASKAAENAKAAAKAAGLDKTRKAEFQSADNALNQAKKNKAQDKSTVSAFKAAEGKFKDLLKSECNDQAKIALEAKNKASVAANNELLKGEYQKALKAYDDASKAGGKGDYAKAINLYKNATTLFNSLLTKLSSQRKDLEVSIEEARKAVKYSHDYALEADKRKPLSGDSVKGILKKGERAIETEYREKR